VSEVSLALPVSGRKTTMPADRVYYFETFERMKREAVALITNLVRRAIDARAMCNLALSGAEVPDEIYEDLGKSSTGNSPESRVNWSAVNLFLTDERIVTPGDLDSNLTMIRRTLLSNILHFSGTLNYPDLTLETPPGIATQYEELIRSCFPGNTPWPVFDAITLGLGPDGHTASLFLYETDANPSERWVLHTSPKTAAHPRITLSYETINAARNVIFLVRGRDRWNTVRRVIDGDPSLPASRIRPTRGQLFFLISP